MWNERTGETASRVGERRVFMEQHKKELLRALMTHHRGREKAIKARDLLVGMGVELGPTTTTNSWVVAFLEAVRAWRAEGWPIGSQGGNHGGFWWLASEAERYDVLRTLEQAHAVMGATIENIASANLDASEARFV